MDGKRHQTTPKTPSSASEKSKKSVRFENNVLRQRRSQNDIKNFVNEFLRTKQLNKEKFLDIVVTMYRLGDENIDRDSVRKWIHREPSRVTLDLLMQLNYGDNIFMDQKKSVQVIMNKIKKGLVPVSGLGAGGSGFWENSNQNMLSDSDTNTFMRKLQSQTLASVNIFLKESDMEYADIVIFKANFALVLNTMYGKRGEQYIDYISFDNMIKKIINDTYDVILDVLMVLNYGDRLLYDQKVSVKHIVSKFL